MNLLHDKQIYWIQQICASYVQKVLSFISMCDFFVVISRFTEKTTFNKIGRKLQLVYNSSMHPHEIFIGEIEEKLTSNMKACNERILIWNQVDFRWCHSIHSWAWTQTKILHVSLLFFVNENKNVIQHAFIFQMVRKLTLNLERLLLITKPMRRL